MNKIFSDFPLIPNWMIWVQCICFSVLYAIWALPETILIRHICLIIGALIGLYEIYQFRYLFWQKRAIPVWLIFGFFIWATFHLFYLSNNFEAQLFEYTTIWKRSAIGAIFALGFGIALNNNSFGEKEEQAMWILFYLGLLAPTLIYLIKYFLTLSGEHWDLMIPGYWKLYSGSNPFYLPKVSYVCFCLPILSVAFGQIVWNVRHDQLLKFTNFFYIGTASAVLFVFYSENIKNGAAYSALIFAFCLGRVLFIYFRQHCFSKLFLLGLTFSIGVFVVSHNIQSNPSWTTFWIDARIAQDTQAYPHWKYNGDRGYPSNRPGSMVSATVYERVAWGKVGIELIRQHPFGYGLIERSFGYLSKIHWPDSKLHQCHSGWIDLTLGVGIPGFLLIISSLLLLLFQLTNFRKSLASGLGSYQALVWWALLSIGAMWSTTEISQKVYFDNLIFWLSLAAGTVLLRPPSKRFKNSHA